MTMTGEIQGTKKEFIKIFNEMCYSRSGWQVWSDLISTMACSIANAVDRSEPRFSNREKEYAHCIERLGGVDKPAKCFAIVVEALERNPEQDFLGELYMELELGNHWKGQFFTPYCVCKMMSEITVGDVDRQIEEKGYISICDPACGAGATLIAAVNSMRNAKHNFPEPCFICRSGYRQNRWNDVLHTAFASWVCRLYLHRQYHNESACWTRFIPTGNGRAGAVDHTDVSIKCMGVEAAVPFSRKFRRICRYETDYRKRALLYVF